MTPPLFYRTAQRSRLLGLTYPKTPWTTAEENVAEVEFQDPVPAVTRYLPELRDAGAEIVILLSHLGLGGDQRLAEAVPGIDVIVGGHSHNRMAKAEQVGETLIVQAGAHGSDLGRLDLDIENGRLIGHRRTLISLDHDHEHVESDASAEQLLIELLAPHCTALEEIVGMGNLIVMPADFQQHGKTHGGVPVVIDNEDVALVVGVGRQFHSLRWDGLVAVTASPNPARPSVSSALAGSPA